MGEEVKAGGRTACEGEAGERVGAECVGPARAGFPLLTDPVSLESVSLFVENLLRGSKQESDWACGIEFELFGYDRARDFERLTPAQVQSVLAGFAPSSDHLVREGEVVVEVSAGRMGRLTVEPGGQVEFSGAPQRELADVDREVRRYLSRLREVAEANDFTFVAAGFDPLRRLEEQRWFPKMRYEVMRPYLARRGARAWDMMTRTCAVQCNLDYGPPDDLARKFQLGNRLAPVFTAIFANSPFENGRPSGYKSTRAAAWLRTDPDRTGPAPPALGEEFTPDSYVAYVLDVPMIFSQREGRYLNATSGLRFGEFLEGGAGDLSPVFGDWADHLTTLFTDARLKQHVELRCADGCNPRLALAVQALWKGLMYDPAALDEALRLVPRLGPEDALALREAVARDALAAECAGVRVLPLAREVVRLAAEGLRRTAPEEGSYLDVLRELVIEGGICPADVLLHNYEGSWHGSIRRVLEYLRAA